MRAFLRRSLLAVALLAMGVQQVWAAEPVLLGTTGACNNDVPGGPCKGISTLVQVDPLTGALIRSIGPVGYVVNGLASDPKTGKLYASTAIGDVNFHGLITINPVTGAGTPVDPNVHNFGLPGADSPIHSVVIDPLGNMVAWYDEFAAPGAPPVTDTFVRLNKRTGVATEFPNTGIDSFQNGVAFQAFGPFSILWNINGTSLQPDGTFSQTAYVLNPFNGKPLISRPLTPPLMAALGDFHPVNHRYYGLNFVAFDPTAPTTIVVVDPIQGTTTPLGTTVKGLHVLAFVKPRI
jgi:hypothetical protein